MRPHQTRWGAAAHSLARAVVLLAAAGSDAQAVDWVLSVHSERFCEAVALSQLGSDEAASRLHPKPGQNLAYVQDEVRASARKGDWTLSVLARQRATAQANHDALDLTLHVNQGEAPAEARSWQPWLRFQQFAGAGLELTHHWAGEGWGLQLGLQALQLRRWREWALEGQAGYLATATGGYQFDLQASRVDSGLQVPFQEAFAARGVAWLSHARLELEQDAWLAWLGWRDAGELRWAGVPQQSMQLSTHVLSTDEHGFVIFRPLIQGQYRQGPQRQGLAPWWQLGSRRALAGGHALSLGLERPPGLPWLAEAAWHWPAGGGQGLVAWRPREARWDLGWSGGAWTWRVGADRLGAGAQARTVALSWQQPI